MRSRAGLGQVRAIVRASIPGGISAPTSSRRPRPLGVAGNRVDGRRGGVGRYLAAVRADVIVAQPPPSPPRSACPHLAGGVGAAPRSAWSPAGLGTNAGMYSPTGADGGPARRGGATRLAVHAPGRRARKLGRPPDAAARGASSPASTRGRGSTSWAGPARLSIAKARSASTNRSGSAASHPVDRWQKVLEGILRLAGLDAQARPCACHEVRETLAKFGIGAAGNVLAAPLPVAVGGNPSCSLEDKSVPLVVAHLAGDRAGAHRPRSERGGSSAS
jgi:hypothetical protein